MKYLTLILLVILPYIFADILLLLPEQYPLPAWSTFLGLEIFLVFYSFDKEVRDAVKRWFK